MEQFCVQKRENSQKILPIKQLKSKMMAQFLAQLTTLTDIKFISIQRPIIWQGRKPFAWGFESDFGRLFKNIKQFQEKQCI